MGPLSLVVSSTHREDRGFARPRRRALCAKMSGHDDDCIAGIVSEIVSERRKGASKTSAMLEARKLHEAWDALNVWLADRVVQRKGASVPNFARFTWQVMGGFAPADLDPRLAGKKAAGKIPLRPVFMFHENFCRSHGLPWRRQADHDLVKCGDLDYSNLALRYSIHLTKDMCFAALRDITRRIGERVASGFSLKLRLSVGTLVCENGRPRFDFDSAALAPKARLLATPTVATPTVDAAPAKATAPPPSPPRSAREPSVLATPENDDESSSEAPPRLPRLGSASAASTGFPDRARDYEYPDEDPAFHASILAKTNGEIMRNGTDALLGMLPQKNHLHAPRLNYRRDRDPGKPLLSELNDQCKSTGLLAADSGVEHDAYTRHLSAIEHEANRIQDEQVVFQNLLAEGYAADEAKRQNWKRANLELQDYLQSQINTKQARKAKAAEIPDDERLAAAAKPATKEQLKRSTSVAESLKQPNRAMKTGPFKMYNITGYPTRGRHSNVTSSQLCDELTSSIVERKKRVETERESILMEERRFIDHVNGEMRRTQDLAREKTLAANNELLRAWETSQHVKNLQRLQTFGAKAMLSYAKSASATPDGETAETLHHPPTLPPTRQLAATIADSKARGIDLSCGFDPRDATQDVTGELQKVLIDA